jgi:hypothetical protein
MIDLRSDIVNRPTSAMLDAMMRALWVENSSTLETEHCRPTG